MPRNVRNFWLHADIDGRRSPFASGPVRKDGGFDLAIKMRHHGRVVTAATVIGRAYADGTIRLTMRPEPIGTYIPGMHDQTIEAQTEREEAPTMHRDTKLDRLRRLCARLERIGFDGDEINTLRRIEGTLRRWSEQECGDGNEYGSWCLERDEQTGIPYRVHYSHTENKARRTRVPDRELGALNRLHDMMRRHPGVIYYHQTDPRGCALYLIDNRDGQTIPTDEPDRWIESHYNSHGIAVCE